MFARCSVRCLLRCYRMHPLCCTSMNYVVIPVLCEISNLIETPVPNSGEEAGAGSDTHTLPYGVGEKEDFDLHPMLY